MKIKKNMMILIFSLICIFSITFGEIEVDKDFQLPTEDVVEVDEDGKVLGKRKLEKNYTVMLESKVRVSVPLEIISDIEIEALVIENQKIKIPFDIEFNREPDRKNFYKIKYSELEIDIDNDGKIDTFIYSPPFINKKIQTENIVYIDGEKISKEGTHKRTVYMTIEIKE